ncbi:hypothetical protein SG34_009965 [Thalassomonas viridans]|uniref:Uncharacterized protein n=1 Tax=Thalassomonas viridans TaxID=137584 RepID=A0AAF0C967_9GAMM|nr:hypothetical protein [Thalassomonas viridans]WDE07182.1 hypothetical protein SG34_009965 [Thalassomonas viridans]
MFKTWTETRRENLLSGKELDRKNVVQVAAGTKQSTQEQPHQQLPVAVVLFSGDAIHPNQ